MFYPVHTSKAPVLQFSKRIHTGYFAGIGTRTIRTHDAPIFYFFKVGKPTVRRWYSQGTGTRTIRTHEAFHEN